MSAPSATGQKCSHDLPKVWIKCLLVAGVANERGEISKPKVFVISVLVSYQSWRSGWSQTSCPLRSVTSSLNTVSASKWFMCPTSPTSPTRTPPTRDSCELIHVFISFFNVEHIQRCFLNHFLNSGMKTQASGGLWRNWSRVLFVRGCLSAHSLSSLSRESRDLSCWSRCVYMG